MDDNQASYAKDTTTRLIELLQTTFGTAYTYFEATPATVPPATDFPLMIIQKISGKAIIGPTTTDEVHEQIAITIMHNKADDVGSANVRTTSMRHLENVVEGQDPTTNQYLPNTVLFALRTYLTLTEWLINTDVNIKYDQIPQKDLPTIVIADVVCDTWRRVIVPNRQ